MAVLKTALSRQTTENSSCSVMQRIPVYTRKIHLGPLISTQSVVHFGWKTALFIFTSHCHSTASRLAFRIVSVYKFRFVFNESNKINEANTSKNQVTRLHFCLKDLIFSEEYKNRLENRTKSNKNSSYPDTG